MCIPVCGQRVDLNEKNNNEIKKKRISWKNFSTNVDTYWDYSKT